MADQTSAEQTEVASEVAPTEQKVDTSQGYPVKTEEPKTEPVVEEPKVDEPVDDKAVAERLKQTNARQAKLLFALGVDPASDMGEQLEDGLITEEMVKKHVLGRQEQASLVTAPVDTDPLSIAQHDYDTAKVAYNKEAETGGISLQTNNAYMDAIQKLNNAKLDGIQHQITAERMTRQVNANVESVLKVARSTPEYAGMDDRLKESSDLINISFTGIIADKEARGMGLDPAMLNPGQYEYFAKKASEELGLLANHYIEIGRQQAKSGFTPQNVNTTIPVPASGGEGTVIPPVDKFKNVTVLNHKDAAKEYIDKAGVV